MYERITGENPYEVPMRIYPAIHYTMGGLWVDYNLMSTIPGLYVTGEANFSDHGANRLGASALMQGLADGYFVLPYTIGDYLASSQAPKVDTSHAAFRDAETQVAYQTDRLLHIKGTRSVDSFHRDLGKLLWEYCGMGRTAAGLRHALEKIPALREQFWRDLKVLGSGEELIQSLEKAGRDGDFFELAELICLDALERNESCGGHFREEYQTPDGEALRNDAEYSYVAAWQYRGERQLEEVADAGGFFERLVQLFARAQHLHVAPELLAQGGDFFERMAESFGGAPHAAVFPKQLAQVAVEGIDGTGTLDMEQAVRLVGDLRFGVAEGGVAGVHFGRLGTRQIVADGVRQDEVAIGQALHQRARTQAVGPVIGEVRLTRDVEAGDGAHQVVIHPQPAHGVVNGGVDTHGHFVGILAGNALVHVEQVAVALLDDVLAQALDGFAEIQIDAQAGLAHAAAFVANGFGIAGSHVARHQVAEAGVAAFQEIVALGGGDLVRRTLVTFVQRHPDAAVVAQRFAHQGELGLIFARHGDAGRVDLGEARIGEQRALLVSAPDGGGVAALGVRRKIVSVAVTAGAQDDGIGHVGFDLAGDEVAGDDAAGVAVDHHQVEHLVARVHLHLAGADLAFKRLVKIG